MELGGGLELGRAEPRCSESSRAMELQATEEKPGAKMPPAELYGRRPCRRPGAALAKTRAGSRVARLARGFPGKVA